MFCQKSLKYVKIGQKKLYLKKKIHKNPHLKCQNAPFFIKKTYTHFESGAYESGAQDIGYREREREKDRKEFGGSRILGVQAHHTHTHTHTHTHILHEILSQQCQEVYEGQRQDRLRGVGAEGEGEGGLGHCIHNIVL